MGGGLTIGRHGGLPDTHGLLQTIAVPDPALQTEWSQTVPPHTRWLIRAIRFEADSDPFTGSALRPWIKITSGTTAWLIPSAAIQPARTTQFHNWTAGGPVRTNIIAANHHNRLPERLLIAAGDTIASANTGLGLDDFLIAINITAETWLDG